MITSITERLRKRRATIPGAISDDRDSYEQHQVSMPQGLPLMFSPPLLPFSIHSPATGTAVHLVYDIDNPPPRRSPNHVRFVCISDTHSKTCPVPDGDVLLHSGDLTSRGLYENFEKTVNWVIGLPHETKM
jgi:hypothetical protein